MTGRAQRLGGRDRGHAFLLGGGFKRRLPTRLVALASVGQHAHESCLGRQRLCYGQEQGCILRLYARAMAVAIELDEHRDGVGRIRRRGHRYGLLHAVQQNGKCDPALAKPLNSRQFVRGDADGVGDVGYAMPDQFFRLAQCGDRGRTVRTGQHSAEHIPRFGRLEMRTEGHSGFLQAIAQTEDVGVHPRLVDKQAGRVHGLRGLRKIGWQTCIDG